MRRLFLKTAQRNRGRDDVIKRGAAKGLLFNAGESRNLGYLLGTYEPEVQKLYSALVKPGMVVYDVGANVGFLSMLGAWLAGPTGHVFCFEPLPSNADAIRHNIQLNAFENVTVIPFALGDKQQTVEFLVSADVGWGKVAGLPGNEPQEIVNRIQVRADTLDNVVAEANLRPPDIIKIDIEGAEVGMIEGAKQTLLRSRPTLFIELHGTNREVDRLLTGANYQSYVLGSNEPMISAPWYAFVVATLAEFTEKCKVAQGLAIIAHLGR